MIFFKLFHITKTQKGEKIIYKKTMCQQDLILKMFSVKDSLINVSFELCPIEGKSPTEVTEGLRNREVTAAGALATL